MIKIGIIKSNSNVFNIIFGKVNYLNIRNERFSIRRMIILNCMQKLYSRKL